MRPAPPPAERTASAESPTAAPISWSRELAEAIRSSAELLAFVGVVPESLRGDAVLSEAAAADFPVLVPRSFARRMQPGDPSDPLLRQVLATRAETIDAAGFTRDAVGDGDALRTAGLIQKYRGRVLLVATGACAVHCRYCFRRHFPYGEHPRRLDDWRPALDAIADDGSIREVILSGGDPLMLTDARLSDLLDRIEAIGHVRRLRLHTRLPIVLPSRVTGTLVDRLRASRLQPWIVVHANHANEVQGDCVKALQTLVRSGLPTLNQAVWLAGVNDSAAAQADLSESLIDCGVQPYYLHLLDRVAGASHFEADDHRASEAIATMRQTLPGYAVPTLVREIAGEASKTPQP